MPRNTGFPGMGGGNMQNMLKQAQKLQAQMEKKQEELQARVFEATSGGGAVTVKLSGNLKFTEITIKKEAVDPEDVEMLQDLVLAAVNEALADCEATKEKEMSSLTGGRGGLF